MRRVMKFLHEVGTVGLMGSALAHLILSYQAEGLDPEAYALVRRLILRISEWVLLPSLVVVLTSGLLAMVVHPPFQRAAWALLKALLTFVVFEGTLFAVQGPAQTAASIADAIAAGEPGHEAALAGVVRHERGGLYVLLFLSVANIALAVWRPRLRRNPPPRPPRTGPGDDEEE